MRVALFVFYCLTLTAQDPTLDKYAALGKGLAEEVSRSTTPVKSQEVQDYVARLGARLTVQLPGPALAYWFSTVATDGNALHEPLAIPGGYIFVPSSLMLTANDEAEFAGMLAQAMARESLIRSQRNAGSIAGTTIPVIFIDSFTGNAALPAEVMYQRRAMELQADAMAAQTMARAGFDPNGLVRYLERVQPPDKPRSLFPPLDVRTTALQERIRNIPLAVYTESGEFDKIQERLRPAPPKLGHP